MASKNMHLYDGVKGDWYKVALESDIQDLISTMDDKELQLVPSEQGSRGLRYFNGKLEYSTDNGITWIEIQTGGGSGGSVNVIDNLNSNSSSDVLSANQGRELKSQLDTKANNTPVNSIENGLMISSDKIKLDGIEEGANKTEVDGTTIIVNGDGKLEAVGGGISLPIDISDVTNLQTELDSKLNNTDLTPIQNDIQDIQLELSNKGNVKTVNGVSPDSNGNVEIQTSVTPVEVENVLTSNSTVNALSANMGRVLDGKLASHENKIDVVNDSGHVQIDDVTIKLNADGKIYSVGGNSSNNADDIVESSTRVFVTPDEKNDITHANREVIDRLSESTEGKLLFNGGEITSEVEGLIINHESKKVSDENGVHGLYVTKDKMMFLDENDVWVTYDPSATILPSVRSLLGVSSNDGTSISITWVNPSNEEYEKTELYSSKVNITNLDYGDLQGVATKVVDSNNITSYIQNTVYGDTYYFKAYAFHNSFGESKFATPVTISVRSEDTTAPSDVTNINVTPLDSKLRLTWSNPTDPDFQKVKVVIKEGGYPTSHTDGIVGYEGSSNTATIDSLSNNVTYYIRFFVYDIRGNINDSTNMQISASPISLQNPTGLTVASNSSGTQFTISWNNSNINNFSEVEVYTSTSDLTSKTQEECAQEANLVYNGTATSTNFITTPNLTYYIKVFAKYIIGGTNSYSSGITTSKLASDMEAPSVVTNVVIESLDGALRLTWVNPPEQDLGNVRLNYSTGIINSINDGTMAFNGTGNTVTITGLTNDITYNLRFFTIDNSGNVNDDVSMIYEGTPSSVSNPSYGIKIDETNSNPETALTYINNAVGFTPAKMNHTTGQFEYGSWQDKFPFNQIKPCVLKSDGTVNYYLNPNDYSKKLDGSNADITSGADGNVMVEFPKIYWNIERKDNELHVLYSDIKINDNYECLAHLRDGVEKDKIYISAYLGFSENNILWSLSDKTPTGNVTIANFRSLSQSNGSGFEQMTHYQILMLQILYLVMFKNRNSQVALGVGYTNVHTAPKATGSTNQNGLFYGDSLGNAQMKFCGIEDLWGNLSTWIEGMYINNASKILTSNNNFNDTGLDYYNTNVDLVSVGSNFLENVIGDNKCGFLPLIAHSGSSSTCYCDYISIQKERYYGYGGAYNSGLQGGIFMISASNQYATVGSRISNY